MKSTMTVGELEELLNKYPGDTPVFATWEGVYAPIKDFVVEAPWPDEIQCLVFDVEQY